MEQGSKVQISTPKTTNDRKKQHKNSFESEKQTQEQQNPLMLGKRPFSAQSPRAIVEKLSFSGSLASTPAKQDTKLDQILQAVNALYKQQEILEKEIKELKDVSLQQKIKTEIPAARTLEKQQEEPQSSGFFSIFKPRQSLHQNFKSQSSTRTVYLFGYVGTHEDFQQLVAPFGYQCKEFRRVTPSEETPAYEVEFAQTVRPSALKNRIQGVQFMDQENLEQRMRRHQSLSNIKKKAESSSSSQEDQPGSLRGIQSNIHEEEEEENNAEDRAEAKFLSIGEARDRVIELNAHMQNEN